MLGIGSACLNVLTSLCRHELAVLPMLSFSNIFKRTVTLAFIVKLLVFRLYIPIKI